MRRLCLLIVILPVVVASRPAEACSAPYCWAGDFVPGEGATIPSNAPGLYWRPAYTPGTAPDPASVRLTTVAAPGTPLPFTTTAQPGGDFVIVPTDPLVEGTAYVLEDLATCAGAPGPRVTFMVGPSASLPTSLGTVALIGHGTPGELEVATAVGSCSTTVDAIYVSIELAPSNEATPWMSLLLFETVVDGDPWSIQDSINRRTAPGASWKGRGRDLLFRICTPNPDASYPGMSIGGHDVRFRAVLPGAAAMLATPGLGIELMCDSVDPDPGAGDSGCATTTPASSSLLLVALTLVVRRRRHRRRAQSG